MFITTRYFASKGDPAISYPRDARENTQTDVRGMRQEFRRRSQA
jgi:hypothetical protein